MPKSKPRTIKVNWIHKRVNNPHNPCCALSDTQLKERVHKMLGKIAARNMGMFVYCQTEEAVKQVWEWRQEGLTSEELNLRCRKAIEEQDKSS